MEGFEKRILGEGLQAISSFVVCFQLRIPVITYKGMCGCFVCVCVCIHCVVFLVMCHLEGSIRM